MKQENKIKKRKETCRWPRFRFPDNLPVKKTCALLMCNKIIYHSCFYILFSFFNFSGRKKKDREKQKDNNLPRPRRFTTPFNTEESQSFWEQRPKRIFGRILVGKSRRYRKEITIFKMCNLIFEGIYNWIGNLNKEIWR